MTNIDKVDKILIDTFRLGKEDSNKAVIFKHTFTRLETTQRHLSTLSDIADRLENNCLDKYDDWDEQEKYTESLQKLSSKIYDFSNSLSDKIDLILGTIQKIEILGDEDYRNFNDKTMLELHELEHNDLEIYLQNLNFELLRVIEYLQECDLDIEDNNIEVIQNRLKACISDVSDVTYTTLQLADIAFTSVLNNK